MDTIDNKIIIDFCLKKSNDAEKLEAIIDNNNYCLDFTSDNQSNLREFFFVVLKKMQKENKLIEFKYVKAPDFNNQLFETVALDYVNGLNNEIKIVFDEINKI